MTFKSVDILTPFDTSIYFLYKFRLCVYEAILVKNTYQYGYNNGIYLPQTRCLWKTLDPDWGHTHAGYKHYHRSPSLGLKQINIILSYKHYHKSSSLGLKLACYCLCILYKYHSVMIFISTYIHTVQITQ